MSAVHITFLWPVIITEMVLVFSAMEHELAMEQPEFRFSSKMSNLATWHLSSFFAIFKQREI